jgi:MSHA pilin protein MshA
MLKKIAARWHSGKQLATNKHAGFTLIELVIVITLLGILAAVAFPRFADLTSDARKAIIDALADNIRAARDNARSKWRVDGGSGSSVDLDGTTVTVTSTTGRPTSEAGGIVAALTDLDTTKITVTYPSPAAPDGTVTFTLKTGCTVTYNASTGAVDKTKTSC